MVSGCLSVFCPSACLREFGSQGKNFSEIWYWGISWKSFKKLKIWLNPV
jgi:hypothetical protein